MIRTVENLKAEAINLTFDYPGNRVLKNISVGFGTGNVTALIGPSGCGKTTLLRCFNRMHDLYPGTTYGGELKLYPDNRNIIDPNVHPIEMRMRIGMVFQKPNPYPKSIYENVAFGLRLHGIAKSEFPYRIEKALREAALWDEVKDRLRTNAYNLSGGQQQRLCIARTLATDPEVLLFDEPTSALDPIATAKIEELIVGLKGKTTSIIVTHNMHQAARISDYTGFMFLGHMVEMESTSKMFLTPNHPMTADYITGRFG